MHFLLKWPEKRKCLSPLLSSFAVQYPFRKVQVNQDSLKLNGRNQLLVYDVDISIFGKERQHDKDIYIYIKSLVFASKEIGLEI